MTSRKQQQTNQIEELARQQQLRNEAFKLCEWAEPRLRAKGWHVALTGSTLYGKFGSEKESDIDLVFYPHRDGEEHDESMEDLLGIIGAKNVESCASDDYGPEETVVWAFYLQSGTKVNAWQVEYPL